MNNLTFQTVLFFMLVLFAYIEIRLLHHIWKSGKRISKRKAREIQKILKD
jgi:hypothetical protein